MRKFTSLLLYFFTLQTLIAQDSTTFNYFEYVSEYRTDPTHDVSKQDERLERILLPRLVSVGGNINKANKAITNYARNYTSSNLNTSGITNKYNSSTDPAGCETYLYKHWNELGPFGNNSQSRWGQIHNFEYSPDFATDNTMYSCSYYSGVWKSTDRGLNWNLLTKNRKLPMAGVGDIEIHPLNKDKIFISTGMNSFDPGYSFSNAGQNIVYTQGLFRSIDGGNNWEEILDNNFWSAFEEGGNITQMYIDPYSTSQNRMIVSTSKGAWKCENISAANPIWSKVYSLNSNFYRNVVRDYSSSNHIYLSSNYLTRYNISQGTKNVYTYPKPTNSKILSSTIATSAADGSKVFCYVKIGFPKKDAAGNNILDMDGNLEFENKASIWKLLVFDKTSNTFIETYTKPSFDTGLPGALSSCCDRGINRMPIAVAPNDANTLYFGDRQIYGTSTALVANTFSDIYNFTEQNALIHDDIHVISFAPDNSGVYVGSDGGILFKPNKTLTDEWEVRHQGINNMLLWAMDDSEVNDEITIVGAQDNQTFSKLNSNNWIKFGQGDGYNVGIDDKTPTLALYRRNGFLSARNLITNAEEDETSLIPNYNSSNTHVGNASASIINHPKSSKLIYAFKDGLALRKKKNKAAGDTSSDLWQIISSIPNSNDAYKFSISESNPARIYLVNSGRTNFNGSLANWSNVLYKTNDNGNNWENITTNVKSSFNNIHGRYLPHYVVSGITTSTSNPDKLWISFSGYNDTIKVWSSTDAGLTWQDTDPTNCLPNLPVNDIVYQDGTNDRLYIATDAGVYTKDNNSSWVRYGDIPNIRVVSLKVNKCSGKIKAATYGRGLFETDLMPDNGKITNYYSIQGYSETWTEDKAMIQNISVGSNKSLIIDGMTLYMPKNGSIIVHKNAKLVLKNGAKITNGCGEMWDGITVVGSNNSQQPTEDEYIANNQFNQGVLYMNNATLEHAKEAIRLHHNLVFPNWPQKNTHNGGVVFATNSFFINNRRSAEFMTYNTDASTSVFENCEFITDNDYRLEEHAPYHITMWDNHGVRFLSNKFEDQRLSIPIDDDRKATGIYTIDANFIARGICNGSVNNGDCQGILVPNKFINLKRGIHATASGALSGSLQIYHNEFKNCARGVSLRGTEQAILALNDFIADATVFNTQGAYIEAMSGYLMTRNKFNSIGHSIYLLNSGYQNTDVYQNEIIKDNNIGVSVALAGREDNLKLKIDCNKFEDQTFDFYIGGITNTLQDQGSYTKPSANTFKNSFTTNSPYDGYLQSGGLAFSYYGYSNPPTGAKTVPDFGSPPYVDVIATTQIITSSACPEKPLDEVLVGKEGELSTINLDGYHSILNSLDYYNQDDVVLIDNIVGQLIHYYQAQGQIDKITTLLSNYNDDWHKVQLASFYTLDQKHGQANNLLNSLINTSTTNQDVKDLANLYKIKNDLDKNGKTWFEINTVDKSTVASFAKRPDFKPATVKAKNILMLTDDLFFEEDKLDIDYITSSVSVNAPIKPKMTQFPNPIDGILNLEYNMPVNGNFKVEIYNLLNNSHVHTGIMTSSLFSLDVSSWNSGFYSIVVTDEHGELIYKSSTKIKN